MSRRDSFLSDLSKEDFAGQITIQCSEGSSATGQYPKNRICHGFGEGMINSGPPVE
jgi:hypothetical protein